MSAYMYRAALHCEDCGNNIKRRLEACGRAPADPDDECSFDSDDFPKGPYPGGGGEADSPQYCDTCGRFLENSLTSEGMDYVMDSIIEALSQNKDVAFARAWTEHYGITLEDLLEYVEEKDED